MANGITFEYTYVQDGKKKKGEIETSSIERAYQLLNSRGITPTKIVNKDADVLNKEINIPGFEAKTKLKELALFCRQFALLIRSGVPMLESIGIAREQTEDKVLKRALGEVYSDVEKGNSLSSSMQKHPQAFPDLLVSIVAVGQDGGFLDESLDSMSKTYKSELELRQKIKSALTYPIIVVIITGLVLAAMLIFIVPQFAEMFESMDAKLPVITQILVMVSNKIAILGPIAAVVLLIVFILYKRYAKEEWMMKRVDKWKLKIFVFGSLNTKVAIARFASNLSMMLSSGVPLIQALELVSKTTNNYILSTAIMESIKSMENGKMFSSSIDKFDMFPPMVRNMIVVGERTGKMSTMLATVAEFYEEEVKEASDRLTAAIEPILIVILGVVVGGMLMALYMPMFQIFNVMSSGA